MSSSQANDIWLDQVEVLLPNEKPLFRVKRWKANHGEHILVRGPSGSGKTTFLHLIAGLLKPNKGLVHLGDTKLSELSEDERSDIRRSRVGVVFQKLNLLGQLTVRENIQLGLLSPQEELIANSLARVKISDKMDIRSSYLSLGEQQRVAVARVLAQRPEIILADEPTSSLDKPNAGFVMEALSESARGKTLIVVSHDERIESHFSRVLDFSEITR